MVEQQLRGRNITDPRVLQAMTSVPRHLFVPEDLRRSAYSDGPLPIGGSQTISQPYIVAYMTQLLDLNEGDRVLEIGTGSGYQAAILAHLARRVFSIERIERLAARARGVLTSLGLDNVEVIVADGSCGLPEKAPFERILVTAAAPKAPEPLKEQLGEDGHLVIPVGGRRGQVLERWTRREGNLEVERLAPVAFVPLLGDYGWADRGDLD